MWQCHGRGPDPNGPVDPSRRRPLCGERNNSNKLHRIPNEGDVVEAVWTDSAVNSCTRQENRGRALRTPIDGTQPWGQQINGRLSRYEQSHKRARTGITRCFTQRLASAEGERVEMMVFIPSKANSHLSGLTGAGCVTFANAMFRIQMFLHRKSPGSSKRGFRHIKSQFCGGNIRSRQTT